METVSDGLFWEKLGECGVVTVCYLRQRLWNSRSTASLWWSESGGSWCWMYCADDSQKKVLPGLSLEEAQQVVEVAVRLSGRL